MEKEKKTKNKDLSAFIFLVGGVGIIGGIILGMIIQQMIFGAGMVHIAESFNGNINVNFNETKFVEQSKDILVPAITFILNNSVVRDFSACKLVPCDCWESGCDLYCMQCETKN